MNDDIRDIYEEDAGAAFQNDGYLRITTDPNNDDGLYDPDDDPELRKQADALLRAAGFTSYAQPRKANTGRPGARRRRRGAWRSTAKPNRRRAA